MGHPQPHTPRQKLFSRGQDERIIRVAMDLLRQEGPESVNARRIAKHLDVHPQHVDELFPDDGALWSAILNRVHDSLMRLLEHVAAGATDPLAALEDTFDSHVSYISKNPVIAQLLTHLSQSRGPQLRRQVRRIVQGYESNLAILISLAQKQDLVRPDVEASAAARLFITMIHGLVFRTFMTGESDSMVDDPSQIFSIYVAGIQTHTPKKGEKNEMA